MQKFFTFYFLLLFISRAEAEEIRIETVFPNNLEAHADGQHLLYQVYVEEDGWLPENDRTAIRVTRDAKGRSLLVNDYDTVSLRMNALVGNEVVGTIRIAGSINGKFELEHYLTLNPFLEGMRAASPFRMFEVNRLAVAKKYRQTKIQVANQNPMPTVYAALVTAVNNFAGQFKWNLVAAPKTELTPSLSRYGWSVFYENLKYLSTDANYVNVVFNTPKNPYADVPAQYLEDCSDALGRMFHRNFIANIAHPYSEQSTLRAK